MNFEPQIQTWLGTGISWLAMLEVEVSDGPVQELQILQVISHSYWTWP